MGEEGGCGVGWMDGYPWGRLNEMTTRSLR